jgi:riboflavin biosynthesis pyrimidine reductase
MKYLLFVPKKIKLFFKKIPWILSYESTTLHMMLADPRLTTRQEGGHVPVRVVMSRCLNLPMDAKLWDVSNTQTIVTTQKGARQDFQAMLAARGVEVVEFDFLTPRAVMDYCYHRGYLSVLWECGGMLSAPAIASGVIQKVLIFFPFPLSHPSIQPFLSA